MPGKKKSAKKKAVKKSVKKRMGGGMMGPKKKRAGGGMMGPKKKMARGGSVKRMGGGMMGPKKKLAKGGALKKAIARKSGRLNADDIKRAMASIPTGRSAAAKKAAMKGTKGGTKAALMGSIMKGSGNPAGKDTSTAGMIRRVLSSGMAQRKRRRMGAQGAPKRKK
jgi:hypothetical protein